MRILPLTGVGVVVLAMCGCAATPTETPSARRDADTERLLTTPMCVTFDATPLDDAIEAVRSASGASIDVNWRSLEGAGIEPQNPVTLRVENVTADTVLRLILDQVGGDLIPLGYEVRDGVAIVSTIGELYSQIELRVYNCRDLLHAAGEETARSEDGAVIKMIREMIARTEWSHESSRDAVTQFRGMLLVTTHRPNHEKIERILAAIREASSAGAGSTSIGPRY